MASLEIHDSHGAQTQALDSTLICGRQDDCDLIVDDRRCSKRHCKFERKDGRWRVVDLASGNGTWVNGQAISMVELNEGDEIVIGDVHLIFRHGAGAAPALGSGGTAAKANRAPLIFAGGAVLLAVLVIAMKSGGDNDKDAEAKTKDHQEAAAEPSSLSPEEAGMESAFLMASLKSEWQALVTEDLPLSDFLIRSEELRQRTLPLDANLAETMQTIASDRQAEALAQLRKSLSAAETRAQAAVGAGDFTQALAEFDDLLVELQTSDQNRLLREARESKLKFLSRARQSWEGIEAEVDGLAALGKFDQARDLLSEAVPKFGGTAFEARAQSSIQLLELRAAGYVAPEVADAGDSKVGESSAHLKIEKVDGSAAGIIAAAETAASQRHWQRAAELYQEALGLAQGEALTRSWRQRSEVLAALGRLKNSVVIAVNNEDRRVKSLKIGRLSARPYAADQEMIQLKFGGAGVVTWVWFEVPSETLLDLFEFGVENNEGQLDLARAAIEFHDEKRALQALVKSAQNRGLKHLADEVFASWRGREIPPGGFIVEEGGFWGPDEWSLVELRRDAKKEAAKLVKARAALLPALVAQLKAMGEAALEPLQAALEERYALALENAESLGVIAAPQRYRQGLVKELDERRATALALIRDEKAYPYPYGPDQEKIQDDVNALVERCRQVYEQPSLFLIDSDKGLNEKIAELQEIVSYMVVASDERPKPMAILDRVDAAMNLRSYSCSTSDQKANEEALQFNAEIKSSITPEEREVHRLTNEYRMQMGLRAVKIDEALVLAARGHSQEMKDLGYFAHNSPTAGRTTPGDRCRLAGWGGSASENIARGQRTPAAAVHGWINSSGHHRNILGARWTHLGCGKAKDGFFWTQNFGNGSSSSLSKEKIDPAEREKTEKQPGSADEER